MNNLYSQLKNLLLIGVYKTIVTVEKIFNKGVVLDFLTKDFINDPYKTYNSMRAHKPILFSQTTRLHWVTKMEFAQEMLRDKRFSVDDRKYPIAEKRRKEFKKAGREIMLEQFGEWGVEASESVRVTENGSELFCNFSRELHIK